jgi:hypothetical protein
MMRKAIGVLAVLALAGCGGGGSGGGSGGGTTAASTGLPPAASTGGSTSGAPTGGPILVSAVFRDLNGSGVPSAGDQITLGFDKDVVATGLSVGALRFVGASDTVGSGAGAIQTGPREVVVTLGPGASFPMYETYKPAVAGSPSPAAISLDAGAVVGTDGSSSRAGRPVPIALPVAERQKFQPDQSRGIYSIYRGQMHCHTTYSDGATGIPADAYDMARQYGLDFFVVTDHVEFFPLRPGNYQLQKQQADQRTIDGAFIALWGYEWSSGIKALEGLTTLVQYNHANVLSDTVIDVPSCTQLQSFYWALGQLGDDPIGKFNHPSSLGKHAASFRLKYNDWDDYAYDSGADRFFRLVRVMPDYDGAESAGYTPLLDRGWHVAPGFGEDNHTPDWGHTDRRMGVFATELTRDGVKEAMRARRTFTSQDKDAWVRLVADDPAGDVWMGSSILGPGPVKLKIDGGDPTDNLSQLEIVTQGGTVVQTVALGGARAFSVEWVVDPTDDAYYYARLTAENGNQTFSAPIFIDR